MGLLDLAKSLTKITIRTAILPVAIVKDVVTMGGAITNEPSAVAKNISKTVEDLENLPEKIDE
jgi:hypothetical protein